METEVKMDERFRGKGIWIVGGVFALVFLCLVLCGLGAMVTTALRPGPVYEIMPQVQPPTGQEGVVPPPAYYGPGSVGRHTGFGPFGFILGGIGLLFKLLFLGLLLLLLVGLIRRLFWGPRHWHHRPWGPYHPGKPPAAEEWRRKPHAWGPWAWHGCGAPWDEEAEPTSQEGDVDAADPAYGATD
jgi:hypothetical protein